MCPATLPRRPKSSSENGRRGGQTEEGDPSPPSLAPNPDQFSDRGLGRTPTSLSPRVRDLAAESCGEAKGATRRSRRAQPPPPGRRGASGSGQRGSRGPRAPRAATAGPALTGGGRECSRAAAGAVRPCGRGRRRSRSEAPSRGEVVTPPAGPTRTPRKVGMGGCPGGRVWKKG